jgi:ornithine carbamoyltransferase
MNTAVKQLPQHFLSILDLDRETLQRIILRAIELKQMQRDGVIHEPLKNKTLAMIFEKSSTRTRVSFEAGMAQLGGHALFLSLEHTQLGRGEPVEDAARVISRMVDCVMLRTYRHDTIETFASYSEVPVINGLSDLFHPCQVLADVQTYQEHRGDIAGKKVVWIGDGNNMCNSYISASLRFGFELVICTPKGYQPDCDVLNVGKKQCIMTHDPKQAIEGADLVVTDVWASMGQEQEQEARKRDFAGYMVDAELMRLADSDALFMHCLPAHRGEEVSAEVIDSPQSVVWDEAANRLHAQKALLEYLLVQDASN